MQLDEESDFRIGEEAYFRGDYTSALRVSRTLAQQGEQGAREGTAVHFEISSFFGRLTEEL